MKFNMSYPQLITAAEYASYRYARQFLGPYGLGGVPDAPNEALGYEPSDSSTVWVTNLGNGGYGVVVFFEQMHTGHYAKYETVASHLYATAALREAWRVAVALVEVKTIDRFEQVCQTVFGMRKLVNQSSVRLPAEVRLLAAGVVNG